MQLNGVTIDDTYAEAFPTWVARVVITAVTEDWAKKAATEATGFATSAIGCPCEAGIESVLCPDETPDGRPGVSILICAAKKKIKEQLIERIGECVITSATAAVFDGLPQAAEKVPVKLHFFGDGYEYKKEVGGRQVWAVPIMSGEYIGEEEFGIVKGVAGGNFFVMGENQMAALMGAQAATDAIAGVRLEGRVDQVQVHFREYEREVLPHAQGESPGQQDPGRRERRVRDRDRRPRREGGRRGDGKGHQGRGQGTGREVHQCRELRRQPGPLQDRTPQNPLTLFFLAGDISSVPAPRVNPKRVGTFPLATPAERSRGRTSTPGPLPGEDRTL